MLCCCVASNILRYHCDIFWDIYIFGDTSESQLSWLHWIKKYIQVYFVSHNGVNEILKMFCITQTTYCC